MVCRSPGRRPPSPLMLRRGEVVYRLDQINSEYVWNRQALDAIGDSRTTIRTVPTWTPTVIAMKT